MEEAPGTLETPLTNEAQQLLNQGLALRVAQRVGDIFSSGALSPEELDDRALDALREFNEDAAVEVLNQFASSDLSHVQNKSAFLCGVMKTYREKTRQHGHGQMITADDDAKNGADEEKIKALLERTGYTLDITLGQRKYGGPPPNYEGPQPGSSVAVNMNRFGNIHAHDIGYQSFRLQVVSPTVSSPTIGSIRLRVKVDSPTDLYQTQNVVVVLDVIHTFV